MPPAIIVPFRDKETGKSRGFAFLAYEDQRSTVLAVDNLSGSRVAGRTVRVDHVDNYKIKRAEVGKRLGSWVAVQKPRCTSRMTNACLCHGCDSQGSPPRSCFREGMRLSQVEGRPVSDSDDEEGAGIDEAAAADAERLAALDGATVERMEAGRGAGMRLFLCVEKYNHEKRST